MKQLVIAMVVVIGLLMPVAVGRLRRKLITPRLLDLGAACS